MGVDNAMRSLVNGAEQVLENWEEIKRQERRERQEDTSALADIPRSMPALLRGLRVGAERRGGASVTM